MMGNERTIYPDEGYFFGLGAFETIALEQGTPIFLERHLRRLTRAAAFLELPVNRKQMEAAVEERLTDPALHRGRQALKITVSEKNLLLTVRENPYTQADYHRGFTVDISPVRRNETSSFTYHKTLNYGDCLREKRRARARGIDEPVFLNTQGLLCEGAATNLFFVKEGRLVTPPVSSGLLPGIMREYLCERYNVTEREVHPEELPEFEEMFVTNSLLGVMPVCRIAEHVYTKRECAEKLQMEYQREFMKK